MTTVRHWIEISIELTGMNFLKVNLSEYGIVIRVGILVAWHGALIGCLLLKSTGAHKHLSVPWVGFVQNSLIGEPDDAIKHSDFFLAVGGFTKMCLNHNLEGFCEALFVPLQVFTGA